MTVSSPPKHKSANPGSRANGTNQYKYFLKHNIGLSIPNVRKFTRCGMIAGLPFGVLKTNNHDEISALRSLSSRKGQLWLISEEDYVTLINGSRSLCSIPSGITLKRVGAPIYSESRGVIDYKQPSTSNIPVSILIPTYNTMPMYLDECWESILSQTHQRFEVVFVDSSDNRDTLERLESYCCTGRARVVRCNGKNLPASLNAGIKECEHELIARMDSDDVMVNNRLELQLKAFCANPLTDVVGGQIRTFINDFGSKHFTGTTTHQRNVSIGRLMQSKWEINHPAAMFRKSSVSLVGGYDESFQCAEDLDLWARMLSNGLRLSNIEDTVVYYRLHDGMKCSSEGLDRRDKWIKKALAPFQSRIRVCFVTSHLEYGGAERWLLDVIRATCGVADWTVAVENFINPLTQEAIQTVANVQIGGDIKRIVSSSDVMIAWAAQKPIKEYKCKTKCILVTHSSDKDPWFHNNIVPRIDGKLVDLGVCVSDESMKSLEMLGIRNKAIVHNGIQDHCYTNSIADVESWLSVNEISGFVVSYIARLTREKGFQDLLGAVGIIPEDISIVVAGLSWPPENMSQYALEIINATNGIVRPLGWRMDVPSILSSSDAFINTSHFDAFAYSVVEAWVSGVPVISTRTGIAGYHTDWITPITPGDPKDIARGISVVYSKQRDNQQLRGISDQASSKFGWKKFVSGWKKILQGK